MDEHATGELTLLLQQCLGGDTAAKVRLVSHIHRELHRMATYFFRHERRDHTLQPTALVNELYVRLLGDRVAECRNREHFFALAANTMRRILVDHARAVQAERRGGERERATLSLSGLTYEIALDDILGINEALEKLQQEEPRAARVVELRFFTGLEQKEIAFVLGVSDVTVKRDWRFARAWLLTQLTSHSMQ